MSDKNDLAIDRDQLDLEIIAQPELFYQVASDHALSTSRRDLAYEELKQLDAELNVNVREHMAQNGEKVTEAMVASAVQTHPKHKAAFEAYLEVKLECDQLQARKEAFIQRSYMLRELVQLFVTGYNAESSLGTDTAPVREHIRNSGKARVVESKRKRLAE